MFHKSHTHTLINYMLIWKRFRRVLGADVEKNPQKTVKNMKLYRVTARTHTPAGGCHFLYIFHPDFSGLPSLLLPASSSALAAPRPGWCRRRAGGFPPIRDSVSLRDVLLHCTRESSQRYSAYYSPGCTITHWQQHPLGSQSTSTRPKILGFPTPVTGWNTTAIN